MTSSYMDYQTEYFNGAYYGYNQYNKIQTYSPSDSSLDQLSDGLKSPKSESSTYSYSPNPNYYSDCYKITETIPSPPSEIKYSPIPDFYTTFEAPEQSVNTSVKPSGRTSSVKSGSSSSSKTSGTCKKSKIDGTLPKVTPDVMKKRRLAANARERRRMNNLNDAYEKLRDVLPNFSPDRKWSKFETLQLAQTYMNELKEILNGDLVVDTQDTMLIQ